uniref:Serpentine receptor class gamma n=1 Tax=Caenorhabditis japonica TaxID=281687 RepID=A0A8R1I1Y8_CAEJA
MVFALSASDELIGEMNFAKSIAVTCMTGKFCDPNREELVVLKTITLSVFSAPIIILDGVGFFNLAIQCACIRRIFTKRYFKKGTFFTILFILSITVSFRIIYSIIAISIAALFANTTSPVYKFCTQSSLYVDYCSNFFSLCVTFFMSLNRCFCFTAKTANSLLFDGKHVLFPILFSGLLAISAGIVSVTTSQIQRSFVERLGFVDVGPDVGWKEVINRMFYIFPIGSIVCYVVLYYHLHQQARLVLTQSNQNRGEQKVFVQLLITTVLYGLLALIYELISFISWGNNTDLQLTFISVLNIFNSLPEISLPLLLICSSVQVRRRLAALIAPKAEKTMMTTMATKTTSSATNKDNFV